MSSSSSNNNNGLDRAAAVAVPLDDDEIVPPSPHAAAAKAVACSSDEAVSDSEEEEDYEYEEEDDATFGGFLETLPGVAATHTDVAATVDRKPAPATIEDEVDTNNNNSNNPTSSTASTVAASAPTAASTTTTTASTTTTTAERKQWRAPSRQAVDMSLRAERETSGGKRRLAQDLYRIMLSDTTSSGFSLSPSSDDSMDQWTIQLFQFDKDSNLAKDMMVMGLQHVELEMNFPDDYPFAPPYVRVIRPRFRRQTGFVMNGALCMELLTKDGWSPINDIESVIVSIRSLLVVGDARLEAAANLDANEYQRRLEEKEQAANDDAADTNSPDAEQQPDDDDDDSSAEGSAQKRARSNTIGDSVGGGYSAAEAQSAYSHLTEYHKKKGWDSSGWWARKG